MTLKLTDVHCPHCGKKLCEWIVLERGGVGFTCPRCGKPVEFKEGLPTAGKPTE